MRNKLTVILYASFKLVQLRIKESFGLIGHIELDEEYERLEILLDNTFPEKL